MPRQIRLRCIDGSTGPGSWRLPTWCCSESLSEKDVESTMMRDGFEPSQAATPTSPQKCAVAGASQESPSGAKRRLSDSEESSERKRDFKKFKTDMYLRYISDNLQHPPGGETSSGVQSPNEQSPPTAKKPNEEQHHLSSTSWSGAVAGASQESPSGVKRRLSDSEESSERKRDFKKFKTDMYLRYISDNLQHPLGGKTSSGVQSPNEQSPPTAKKPSEEQHHLSSTSWSGAVAGASQESPSGAKRRLSDSEESSERKRDFKKFKTDMYLRYISDNLQHPPGGETSSGVQSPNEQSPPTAKKPSEEQHHHSSTSWSGAVAGASQESPSGAKRRLSDSEESSERKRDFKKFKTDMYLRYISDNLQHPPGGETSSGVQSPNEQSPPTAKKPNEEQHHLSSTSWSGAVAGASQESPSGAMRRLSESEESSERKRDFKKFKTDMYLRYISDNLQHPPGGETSSGVQSPNEQSPPTAKKPSDEQHHHSSTSWSGAVAGASQESPSGAKRRLSDSEESSERKRDFKKFKTDMYLRYISDNLQHPPGGEISSGVLSPNEQSPPTAKKPNEEQHHLSSTSWSGAVAGASQESPSGAMRRLSESEESSERKRDFKKFKTDMYFRYISDNLQHSLGGKTSSGVQSPNEQSPPTAKKPSDEQHHHSSTSWSGAVAGASQESPSGAKRRLSDSEESSERKRDFKKFKTDMYLRYISDNLQHPPGGETSSGVQSPNEQSPPTAKKPNEEQHHHSSTSWSGAVAGASQESPSGAKRRLSDSEESSERKRDFKKFKTDMYLRYISDNLQHPPGGETSSGVQSPNEQSPPSAKQPSEDQQHVCVGEPEKTALCNPT